MNWGHKIIIVFGLFFLIMGTLIYFSAIEDHQLVTENYCEKELKYQDVINQKVNARNEGIQWLPNSDGICLLIPDSIDIVEGEILLYRASNSSWDKTIPYDTSSNCLKASDFQNGKWTISFVGKSENTNYYSESLWIIG